MKGFVLSILALFAASAYAQERPIAGLLEGEQLHLTSAEGSHLAGTFTHGPTVVAFDSQASDAKKSFDLRDKSGLAVFRVRSDGKTYEESFYGDLFVVSGVITPDKEEIDGALALQRQKRKGDERTLAKLVASPEYATLPFLSRALGINGYRGDNSPAALYVHGLGLASARGRSISVPVPDPQDMNGWKCKDVRTDPCKNNCFGLCGQGCSVWWWVCGDPCQHKGCFKHDIACRLCDCDEGHCVGCYTAVAFLTASPCKVIEGCQTPPC